jgi:hypothetical protein
MDLKGALREQFHAGLSMLADCVDSCPPELWNSGEKVRTYWRIAWHAVYFTHLYLLQGEEDFHRSISSWPAAVKALLVPNSEQDRSDIEPYELPPNTDAPSKEVTLEYIAFVDSQVDSIIDSLDLERSDTGFFWYPNMSKISHELLNLRHLQGHVGQLSELLNGAGIDTVWVSKANSFTAHREIRERNSQSS